MQHVIMALIPIVSMNISSVVNHMHARPKHINIQGKHVRHKMIMNLFRHNEVPDEDEAIGSILCLL